VNSGESINSLSIVHIACEQWRAAPLFTRPNNAGPDQKWLGQVQPSPKIKKKKKLMGRCKSGIKIPDFHQNIAK
jgi:hypothetical protein